MAQFVAFAICIVSVAYATAAKAPNNKNVLFIVVDDLRPYMRPWTDYNISAPNLEKLASQSLVFHNTYVQQAVCGPSRNSFLTGRRPDSTRTWNFKTSFRSVGIDRSGKPGKEWLTLPESLKRSGYVTVGTGKIFHPNSPPRNDCHDPQQKGQCKSWTENFKTTKPLHITTDGATSLNCHNQNCSFDYISPDSQISDGCLHQNIDGKEYDPTHCNLAAINCTDRWITNTASDLLKAVHANTQALLKAGQEAAPWAVFAGFHKPHPNWEIPEKYYEMYADLPMPANTTSPQGAPDMAFYACKSLSARTDVGGPNCNDTNLNPFGGCSYIQPNLPLPVDVAKNIRASYAGGVTWMDSNVGTLLDTLDSLGLYNDTLVVFFGDHGWGLGENNMWCKQANYELQVLPGLTPVAAPYFIHPLVFLKFPVIGLQTRVPMVIRAPWHAGGGLETRSLTELVDVYPTVLDMLGLQTEEALEGVSLLPLFENPAAPFKNSSFSQYPRCMNSTVAKVPPYVANADPCTQTPANQFTHMGYSIRTAEWRYTEWPEWMGNQLLPDWSSVHNNVELYPHAGDDGSCFDCFENVNVASLHPDTVRKLSADLRNAFRPPNPAQREAKVPYYEYADSNVTPEL